jgi:tetratricopeptide (TPR) repeat protein
MCGGALDLPDDVTVGKCPWCGSMTTFPKITSDHVEQLYSRAEHYRHAGDFDKAMSAYEAIVRETPDDAEAYWGLVLSRFGIEYVEDPVSHERIPTCHRVQYESILADGDYQSALEHASEQDTRDMYKDEATRIAKIQKDILAISSQEKPFDVFICYKETMDGGSRTKDSMDAQEIYYQLTNAGYKVFFSRITLEDKLGQQYEPYIFAALNSAKVMLVIGSKKEYFNAVWVKNEWSRFLSLMKKDRSKLLIPCYKDMDVYDLPEELSMLQSQDMSKIGFIQDLLRGIGKVIGIKNKLESEHVYTNHVSSSPLLKRVRLFLETGEFDEAKQYCERILDQEPENAEAYLLRLLAENNIKSDDKLYLADNDLMSQGTFMLLMKFADVELRSRMEAQVREQKEQQEKKEEYCKLKIQFDKIDKDNSTNINELKFLIKAFANLSGYRDADELKIECEKRVTKIYKEAKEKYQHIYQDALKKLETGASPEEWDTLEKTFISMIELVPEAKEAAEQCHENARMAQYDLALKIINNKDSTYGELDQAEKIFISFDSSENDTKRFIQQCRTMKMLIEKKYRRLDDYKDYGLISLMIGILILIIIYFAF